MERVEVSNDSTGEFIVNLVSNASMDVYPNNKLSTFATLLPGNGINLPINPDGGRWEVALTEINFPTKFYNVQVGSFGVTSKKLGYEVWYDNLPEGRYKDAQTVLALIERSWRKLNDSELAGNIDYDPNADIFTHRYNTSTYKLEIKMSHEEDDCHLILNSEDLRGILGFSKDSGMNDIKPTSARALRNDGWVTGGYTPDFQGLHTALVYTDIIEHQIIGDTMAPLLRLIPLTGKFKNNEMTGTESTQVVKAFTMPLQFKKVQVNSFHSIQLEIYGENGKLIPFVDSGRTSATLLFSYNKHG
jgi:hypothetical protein